MHGWWPSGSGARNCLRTTSCRCSKDCAAGRKGPLRVHAAPFSGMMGKGGWKRRNRQPTMSSLPVRGAWADAAEEEPGPERARTRPFREGQHIGTEVSGMLPGTDPADIRVRPGILSGRGLRRSLAGPNQWPPALRDQSARTMPAAIAALSDSLPPAPGMCRRPAQAVRASSESPWLSLPRMAHHLFECVGMPSTSQIPVPSMSRPWVSTPTDCNLPMSLGISRVQTDTRNKAPMEAWMTLGLKGSTVGGGPDSGAQTSRPCG